MLQLSGTKEWRHYAGGAELPLADDHSAIEVSERCSVAAAAAALPIGFAAVGVYSLALLASLFTLVLLGGTVVAALAARGSTRRDGDIAFAILDGYAAGQWMPTVIRVEARARSPSSRPREPGGAASPSTSGQG